VTLSFAAERGDVVAHPFERRLLIEEPEISGRPVRPVEKAECADPIVDADHDQVAFARQRFA